MTLCNKEKDSKKPNVLGSDVSELPLIFSDNLYLAGGDTIEDLLACLEFAAESLRLKTQHLALA